MRRLRLWQKSERTRPRISIFAGRWWKYYGQRRRTARLILAEVPAPALTYCRSGTRCAKLWALAEAGKRDVNTLVEAVDKAGLSIVDITHRL